jgi:EAL domain-containing protein (putative c-di-GMP-specific phosphodiesterase class I)
MDPSPPYPQQLEDSIAQSDWAGLSAQLDKIQDQLAERGPLGLLSLSVLERRTGNIEQGWENYETTIRAVSEFLQFYLRRRMRRTDVMVDPIVAGNSFLVFLGPPRAERALDPIDISRVRHRMDRSLRHHLRRALPHPAVERFGVYVGGSLIRHDPAIEARRIIVRGMEAAFADAVNQKNAEGREHAVNLKRVLHEGRLRTVYQAVVDLGERKILGYEALTRVPQTHFQTPDLLFRAAHKNGVLWKLERLTRQCALEALPPLEPNQLLFLNVEPDSIHDPELSGERFLKNLDEVGLNPGRVVLEVTEHVAVKDFAAFRVALERFRSLGFRLAMDDVGSGYAGLQAIAEMSPEYLKVDMTLVRDMHRHPIKRELIRTIRRFTERTGSLLVAEGVESVEELDSLAEAGVRCAQGYLFSRPASRPQQPNWKALLGRGSFDGAVSG